jgi:hypothetical protein
MSSYDDFRNNQANDDFLMWLLFRPRRKAVLNKQPKPRRVMRPIPWRTVLILAACFAVFAAFPVTYGLVCLILTMVLVARALMGITLVLAVLLVGTVAHATEPRSVEWFIMHNQERVAMRYCDIGRMLTKADLDCANAHKAIDLMHAADAQLAVQKGDLGEGSIYSPLYFDAWPIARRDTLLDCANPGRKRLPPTEAECRAARISSARNGGN